MAEMCGDVLESCVCITPDQHHEEPHLCDCGGSWLKTPERTEIVAFPGGYPASPDGMLDAIRAMFGPE